MTWLFFVLNLNGGQPTFVEMPNKEACEAAVVASLATMYGASVWCVPAGDWEGIE